MAPDERPRSLRLLHRMEEGFLAVLVGAMILLAFAQIILRDLFAASLPWGDPLIRHLVLWTSFLGALLATRRGKHITIDLLPRLLSGRRRNLVEAATGLYSALMCAVLTWISLRFISHERSFGSREFLDLATWELQLIFPLTFGLMSVRFLLRAGRSIACLRGRPS